MYARGVRRGERADAAGMARRRGVWHRMLCCRPSDPPPQHACGKRSCSTHALLGGVCWCAATSGGGGGDRRARLPAALLQLCDLPRAYSRGPEAQGPCPGHLGGQHGHRAARACKSVRHDAQRRHGYSSICERF